MKTKMTWTDWANELWEIHQHDNIGTIGGRNCGCVACYDRTATASDRTEFHTAWNHLVSREG